MNTDMNNTMHAIKCCGAAAALLLALASHGSTTSTSTPTTAPASTAAVAQAGQALVGQGLLRVWGFQVYNARLLAEPGFNAERFAQARFSLELEYLRSFTGRDIAQRSVDEMRGVVALSDEQQGRFQAAIANLFPDVNKGDRIVGLHLPGAGASFYLNGKLLGEVVDPTFSEAFFAIWLSPKTSQPGLRKALIAQP